MQEYICMSCNQDPQSLGHGGLIVCAREALLPVSSSDTRTERQFICHCRTNLQIPVTFYEVYSFVRDKTTQSYCTSSRLGYPTNTPTCLSDASGTLLETTPAILWISIASLVSRVYLARKSTKRQISDDVQTRMDTRQQRQ